MVESPYTDNYIRHYQSIIEVYPSVLALKMFLGRNPELDLRGVPKEGRSILDVGFGDGRDLILFHKLGFDVYGIEVNDAVVSHTRDKLSRAGINANLSVGYNEETGFAAGTFDFVFANASLMYLRSERSSIHRTLDHVREILKPEGCLLGTFTAVDSHISKGGRRLDRNRIVCEDSFYKQRKGQMYWLHHCKEEVENDLLNSGFNSIKVHDFDVDWFGTREKAFIFFAAN